MSNQQSTIFGIILMVVGVSSLLLAAITSDTGFISGGSGILLITFGLKDWYIMNFKKNRDHRRIVKELQNIQRSRAYMADENELWDSIKELIDSIEK